MQNPVYNTVQWSLIILKKTFAIVLLVNVINCKNEMIFVVDFIPF